MTNSTNWTQLFIVCVSGMNIESEIKLLQTKEFNEEKAREQPNLVITNGSQWVKSRGEGGYKFNGS